MTKNVGNYIGFTTDGVTGSDIPLNGIWSIFDHSRYKRNGKWPIAPSGVTATGTYVQNATEFFYTTFTGPGTLVVSRPVTVEVLMVGGGGGGGNYTSGGNGGGGGGAGGLVYVPTMTLPGPATYPVTTGSGGSRGALNGTNGSPTTFNGFTALGGGFGGGYSGAGGPGGSGGTGSGGPYPGIQPTQPQPLPAPSYFQYGNPSGIGNIASGIYDGGGGAGGPGVNPTPQPSPALGGPYGGGVGRQYPQFAGPTIGIPSLYPLPQSTPQSGWYAGGGGGGGYNNPTGLPWGGGAGGGGGPAVGADPSNYFNGVANTGGGGAGGANGLRHGNGGSGIVSIRVI